MNRRNFLNLGLASLVGTGALAVGEGCIRGNGWVGLGTRIVIETTKLVIKEEQKKKAIAHETPKMYVCNWKDHNRNSHIDTEEITDSHHQVFSINDHLLVAAYLANPQPVNVTVMVSRVGEQRPIFARTFANEPPYLIRYIEYRQNTLPAGAYQATAKTSTGVELSCGFEVRQSDK